jgi:hypothetical protein
MTRRKRTQTVIDELAAVGIKPTIKQSGGGHYKFYYRIPTGEQRMIVTAASSSDRRADENIRACVRRMLRADGLATDCKK